MSRSGAALALERGGPGLKEVSMPYLLIQTNQPLGDVEQNRLLADASKIVAATLNKPEKYVMVAWAPAPKMMFDGDPAGAVFLELRSVGIPESGREKIPGALAQCLADCLGISPDRVYLVMVDVPAKYWGQGEQTFG
jgi:phenylpyruvate tautomerase